MTQTLPSRKGTNGRCRAVLTPDELAMYEAAKRRVLSPDCAAFAEMGRIAFPGDLAGAR